MSTRPDMTTDQTMLRAELAKFKTDLTWRLAVMTGVCIAAVIALRIFS